MKSLVWKKKRHRKIRKRKEVGSRCTMCMYSLKECEAIIAGFFRYRKLACITEGQHSQFIYQCSAFTGRVLYIVRFHFMLIWTFSTFGFAAITVFPLTPTLICRNSLYFPHKEGDLSRYFNSLLNCATVISGLAMRIKLSQYSS